MNIWMSKLLGSNWKTTLLGIVAFLASVPSLVTAFTNWVHHQPADWRMACFGIVTGLIGLAAKDSTTHSTADQVQAATIEKK